jgi:4-cresol dehydrogenase (hydroxylating) flavoprotein subunit
MRLIRERVESFGFDYAGGFTTFPRHAIALALISFDKSDEQERTAVATMFPQLIGDAARQHYAPYWAHVAFMEVIADQYNYGDHGARYLQQTIEDAVDPAPFSPQASKASGQRPTILT